MNSRIVITGMGTLSAAGGNLEEFAANITGGHCCLSPLPEAQCAHLKARYAGLLCASAAQAVARAARDLQTYDRHVPMALVAAREALALARIQPADHGIRMGLLFATCSGPMLLIEQHYERILQNQPALTGEQLFAKRYYAGAEVLAQLLGIHGYVTTVVTACSASTAAIAMAADLIRCGLLDVALAGGADTFSYSTLAGFDGLKATSAGKCAPFSRPPGLNLGEAAGFVVLESLASARQRGATVHAEILGSGTSNDAFHCSAPDPSGRGLAVAMQRALHHAHLTPAQIHYVNAHGTGTEANDKAETKAIRKVMGDHASHLAVSSTKSMVGHCLGAAGVLETMASIVAGEAGVLPPTANFTEPRDGCALDYVPDAGRPWSGPRCFLTNNAAFGGHNASLAVAVGEAPPRQPEPRPAPSSTIVLTACGLITAAGLGTAPLRQAMENRTRHTRAVTLLNGVQLEAGLVEDQGLAQFDRRLDWRDMLRSSRWATAAVKLALKEAGLADRPGPRDSLGLYLSLAAGPSEAESQFLTAFLSNQRRVDNVVIFPYIVPSSVTGDVCRALMLHGHNVTLSGGPGAGLLGFAPALAALRSGHVATLLCGSVDELTDRIMADHLSAGWCGLADGQTPGEGAAVFLLETAEHAQHRGARPLAQVCSAVFRAGSPSAPLPGLAGAPPCLAEGMLQQALEEAGLKPGELGAVCVAEAGEGTRQALDRVCPGWRARQVDASSVTGRLEASQSLVDLAASLQGATACTPGQPGILAVLAPAHGMLAALVLKKFF